MQNRHLGIILLVAGILSTAMSADAQVLKTRPETPVPPPPVATPHKAENIRLVIPSGTAVKVALDREVRVRRVGQPVHGRVIEPVYSFDQVVVPAGTEVLGRIVSLDQITRKTRILAGMNANFSPAHKVGVQFDKLVLQDGRHVPIQAEVSPASSGVLRAAGQGTGIGDALAAQAGVGQGES